jgi:hypothetical protein
MDSQITKYAFLRFFGIAFLSWACWNFYLLRLLNGWFVIDLIHIGLGIAGVFFLGILVLWKARNELRDTPSDALPQFLSIYRNLNLLYLLATCTFVIGDAITIGDFFYTVQLVNGGSISEEAYIVRDVSIARIGAFVLLAIYLGIGLRNTNKK